jgi:minichromosome maintenance protein 10
VVRAQPVSGAAGGQVYDVPVAGDWVTIAVVAERSPIRVSRAPVTLGPGEARDADDPDIATASLSPSTRQNSKKGNKDPPPRAGRKYVNLSLVDFGAGGKKGTSRGDATLSLLLFESDAYDTVSRGDGLLPEKVYKGGSRGAFETMAKLREGSVIALLNPRVLKPLQVVIFDFSPLLAAKVGILAWL